MGIRSPADKNAGTCKCQNCNWCGSASKLNGIENPSMRIRSGEKMPAGECAECGSLAHPLTPKETLDQLRGICAALANLDAITDTQEPNTMSLREIQQAGGEALDLLDGLAP